MERDYIAIDSEGYLFNSEFKPDFVKNGDRYHGYKTNNQEAFFYYFAVLGYDLQFKFKGTTYYFLSTENYVARTNENFSLDIEVFANANEMVKIFEIDGNPLVSIIDDLEDVDIL